MDAVVRKLEEEFTEQQEEANNLHQQELERISAQHTSELTKARTSADEWRAKFKQLYQQHQQLENTHSELQNETQKLVCFL